MSRFQVQPVSNLTVREEGKARVVSDEFEERVALAWRAESADRNGEIFDAPIFNVTLASAQEVRGHFVPYRWWIAQLRHPELREVLGVNPGSACALTFAGDAMLFGRRSAASTQDPGAWEPVPAGGIGIEARNSEGLVSAELQIKHELEEELGLPADRIARLRPFAIVVDSEMGVHDLAFEMQLSATASEIEAYFHARSTKEVTEYRAVPLAEIESWIRDHASELSPITEVLLDAYRKAQILGALPAL